MDGHGDRNPSQLLAWKEKRHEQEEEQRRNAVDCLQGRFGSVDTMPPKEIVGRSATGGGGHTALWGGRVTKHLM